MDLEQKAREVRNAIADDMQLVIDGKQSMAEMAEGIQAVLVLALREARAEGAREMRERAVQVAEGPLWRLGSLAAEILALPIEEASR